MISNEDTVINRYYIGHLTAFNNEQSPYQIVSYKSQKSQI